MANLPVPPGGGAAPGIPPGGIPAPTPGPPVPPAPGGGLPSAIPQPPPSPTFHELPSRLPHGIQMLDGASRNMKKALGTVDFIENPPERATLLQLTRDTDDLITRMTRKLVGAQPSGETEPSQPEGQALEVGSEEEE
jgi:hypothetical protein